MAYSSLVGLGSVFGGLGGIPLGWPDWGGLGWVGWSGVGLGLIGLWCSGVERVVDLIFGWLGSAASQTSVADGMLHLSFVI